MRKSLRKGYFHLELNHEYGADTIGAEAAEVELKKGVAIFRAKLNPASENQILDAVHCKEQSFKNVESFSFIDEHIRKGMSSFVKINKAKIKSWRIEIDYEQKYDFCCEIQSMNPDGLLFHVVSS
ncbi:hypothetical protein H9X98_04915 [Aeromonas jandaei]|uniref:hypothetical protein n=1 Tax=Aeromonas jandaei TaxID=650 RepID=UPI001F2A699C|nr:hypothetical protein [Aeromonas jandaei]MCF7717053.1 hypothetical protein [Aeromonas jandaei]